MKNANRDLLVLMKDTTLNDLEIEMEVKQLNFLLMAKETIETFCQVSDIIDISRNKMVKNYNKIKAIMEQPILSPFLFICNKN
jgi:hypothetical protein